MRYTVHELEKMKFPVRLRGYDRREVERVMQEMARQTEELLTEIDRLKQEVKQLKERLAQYQNMEESLKKSLLIAQQTKDERIAQANREAELILREARRHEGEVRQEIVRLEALRDQFVLEIHSLLTRLLTQLKSSYPELVQRIDEPSSSAGTSGSSRGESRQEKPQLAPASSPATQQMGKEPILPREEAANQLPREDELPTMVPPEPPTPKAESEEETPGEGIS